MPINYRDKILAANVQDIADRTPLSYARKLSARYGNSIWLKREDMQPVFSFKLRGAYLRLSNLSAADKARGVICSSAGNHAQGVALASQKLGIKAIMVMPETTPDIKLEAVRSLGGEVIIYGASYDDAYQHALQLSAEQNLFFVHPFDDVDVIAGQGTVGKEVLEQSIEEFSAMPDAIFVPVGGGGLIAGIAAWVKSEHPATRIIGVEPKDSAAMLAALQAGEVVTLDEVGLFADGVAVKRVGEATFAVCRRLVDEIITVDTDETCAAIKDIFEDTRTIVEPAGALAVAGAKKYASRVKNQNLVAINSGANVSFYRLRHVAERAAIGEQREALLAVQIPEQQGAFLNFCRAIGKRNVTEFNYRIGNSSQANIFVGLETANSADEIPEMISRLQNDGYKVINLSDNEAAKVHMRHMVGGLAPGLIDEKLIRFAFPERPGALLSFLQEIGSRWNISLFHYRNNGADYGRVLTGIQVPQADEQEFKEHLRALAYPYWDETANPAYQVFLAGHWPAS